MCGILQEIPLFKVRDVLSFGNPSNGVESSWEDKERLQHTYLDRQPVGQRAFKGSGKRGDSTCAAKQISKAILGVGNGWHWSFFANLLHYSDLM